MKVLRGLRVLQVYNGYESFHLVSSKNSIKQRTYSWANMFARLDHYLSAKVPGTYPSPNATLYPK